ncbi:enoyl-CoA hydratase [Ideonella sp. DXS29W]|uniref:Enoyl-CoA hydratase n=1 Tax=Ideonella lacteola TaxID=2984193 RepID=A0ABU9BZL6_9BURK
MPSVLLTAQEDRTLILTLSDPATRNSLSPQAVTAAIESLNQADQNPEIRAVVLRGDGAHFCAGGDLNRISGARERPPEAQAASIDLFHSLVEAMRSFPKPIIAAVEGYAAGGGMSLALACDLIVAASDARFVLSYAKVGFSPDGASTWHLARALPRALALELAWLAEPQSAERLHALGVVNRLAEPGQALNQALTMARQLSFMAPNAVATVKELVQAAPARSLQEGMNAERDAFVTNLFHPNGGEGLAAFFGKRKPDFK